jgi:uncharacterized membrane protein HdeD (DUF308 family)
LAIEQKNPERRSNMDDIQMWPLVIGIISILFGILVMVWPKIIAYLVGLYFIAIGVLWIIDAI